VRQQTRPQQNRFESHLRPLGNFLYLYFVIKKYNSFLFNFLYEKISTFWIKKIIVCDLGKTVPEFITLVSSENLNNSNYFSTWQTNERTYIWFFVDAQLEALPVGLVDDARGGALGLQVRHCRFVSLVRKQVSLCHKIFPKLRKIYTF
jgi:hypothetical protein